MELVDQAILGYDNGHRMLASSRALSTSALATLVATSDTAVGAGRVVTGQLLDSETYALCVTWPAPEISRPGAVWAHALLFAPSTLDETPVEYLWSTLDEADGLIQSELGRYREPRQVREALVPEPELDDLRACIHATYASRRRVAQVSSPAAAEAAIVRLWSAQWPALRHRFSFRTRTEARSSVPDDVDLYVVVGSPPAPQPDTRDTPWVAAWARELQIDAKGSLTNWVATFGPSESPRPASVRALGRLWALADELEVNAVAQRLVERYPQPSLGRTLKIGLFGPHSHWWQATETQLLIGILSSDTDGWDPADLSLSARLTAAVAEGAGTDLLAALPDDPPLTLARVFLDAVISEPQVDVLVALEERNHEWAVEVVKNTDLALQHETWAALSEQQTARLLTDAELGTDSRVVSAALCSGQLKPVLEVGDGRTIGRAVAALDDQSLSHLASLELADKLVDLVRPADLLRLAEAGAPVADEQRRNALRAQRMSPDDVWFRQAAHALAEDPGALPAVFGPLHSAAAERRLPPDLLATIAAVAPQSTDPARGLRLMLVRRARTEKWQTARVREALQGAGPAAKQVLDDLDDNDPLLKFFKRGLKRLRLR